MASLMDILDRLTAPGELYQPEQDGSLRCHACAHRCRIRPGRRGICQVRFNRDGELRVPHGYVAGLNADPIEKKPLYHLLPGSSALTFGMLGCNFHCSFCQNWISSQEYSTPAAGLSEASIRRISPEQIIEYALHSGCEVVVSSYNEPLITTEWAVSIFRLAKQAGLHCAFVSNGYATPEALDYLHPYLTAFKVDLKTMQDRRYRSLGGVLQNVLDAIRMAHERRLWVEVVTLVIPGFNDSPAELWDAARYLVSVSPDIPWHLTAFHPDYKLTEPPPTPSAALKQAAEIGQEAGLRYVYAGNLPGRVGELENTYCPACQARLITRRGFIILEYHLTAAGGCPKCGVSIPGVWSDRPDETRLGGWGVPRRMIP
ncbi:MAG: AmmeMemoRadiSam system radical SAM enzyme [Anaerolineaceae bacterium]|nr:AmmeMemoRadiSam system radical SAM enzyme [Anaerolineaceae bacterium]